MLPQQPSRPRLVHNESSKVDMAAVLETLRAHGGYIDLEEATEQKVKQRGRRIDVETQTHFPLGSTRSIDEVPLGAIYATIILSWNAVLMMIGEIVIEIFVLTGIYPKIPFRLSFFFLTILSGILGAQALVAVNRKEFDTSQNALVVSFLIEIALIIGDIAFVLHYHTKYPAALPTRAPFGVLTLVNVFLVIYLVLSLRLYERRTTHELPECVQPVDLGLGTFEEIRRTIVPPVVGSIGKHAWTLDDLGAAVVKTIEDRSSRDLFLPSLPPVIDSDFELDTPRSSGHSFTPPSFDAATTTHNHLRDDDEKNHESARCLDDGDGASDSHDLDHPPGDEKAGENNVS